MRIISGSLKGKTIDPPASFGARPTTDFAREALFDILGGIYDWEDLQILDLFAGTGAVSYEFISRGAGHCWCVEMNPRHASFISSTASRLGIADRITVVRHNVFDFLSICSKRWDIVFADPPYALEGLETIPDKIFAADILHPGCYFVLEHGSEHSFTSHPRFVRERVYGRVHFSFFVSEEEEEER